MMSNRDPVMTSPIILWWVGPDSMITTQGELFSACCKDRVGINKKGRYQCYGCGRFTSLWVGRGAEE